MPGSGLAAELPRTVEQACAGSKSSLSGCPVQWERQDPILGGHCMLMRDIELFLGSLGKA